MFKKRYNFIFEKISKNINKKRVLRFMVFLSIGSFSWVVFGYIDMIMIGIFLPAEYAGYYKAATNIIYGICGLTGLTTVLFPIFTQLEGESMESAFKKVFKYSCIVTIPFAFSIAFFSDEIVRAIYGANYIPSTIALAILTPIIITNAINFFGDLLTAKEKPEFTTAISILSMITNIVLNYILIPMYGIAGAAFATSFSRVLNLVSMGIISKMIVGISLDILLVCKPTFSSVLMILLFHILPKPESILEGILEFLTGIFFYFFVMFLIRGITREDIRYIKSILSISTTSV
jgi:O-antigen/teichoic acid export membrane protein